MINKNIDNDKIKETLIKLEPVLGIKKINEIWLTYCSGDSNDKQQIEQILSIMSVKLLGQTPLDQIPLFVPPEKEISDGQYYIGDIIYGNKVLHKFGLRPEELKEHACLFGRTGSGKSMALFNILTQVLTKTPEIKLLAFDWKQELRSLINDKNIKKNLTVYTVGRNDISPFKFNPLIPPPGLILSNHVVLPTTLLDKPVK